MPGTKQHSGGTRPGAGRKPRSMKLHNGSTISVMESINGQPVEYGGSSLPAAQVTVVKRGVVELAFMDGRKLRLWLQDSKQ